MRWKKEERGREEREYDRGENTELHTKKGTRKLCYGAIGLTCDSTEFCVFFFSRS